MMEGAVISLVLLFYLVPFLVVLWAIINAVKAMSRMAAAQEASATALRTIAEDLGASGRPQT